MCNTAERALICRDVDVLHEANIIPLDKVLRDYYKLFYLIKIKKAMD